MKYSQEEIKELLKDIPYKIAIQPYALPDIVAIGSNNYTNMLTLKQAQHLFKALGKQITNLKHFQKETKCRNCNCGKE